MPFRAYTHLYTPSSPEVVVWKIGNATSKEATLEGTTRVGETGCRAVREDGQFLLTVLPQAPSVPGRHSRSDRPSFPDKAAEREPPRQLFQIAEERDADIPSLRKPVGGELVQRSGSPSEYRYPVRLSARRRGF